MASKQSNKSFKVQFSKTDTVANWKVLLVAHCAGVQLVNTEVAAILYPAIRVDNSILFGATSICRYFLMSGGADMDSLLEIDMSLTAALGDNSVSKLTAAMQILESKSANISAINSSVLQATLFHNARQALQVLGSDFPGTSSWVQHFAMSVGSEVLTKLEDVALEYCGRTRPVDLSSCDWATMGLFSGLKLIFTTAIQAAFPQATALNAHEAIITRCGNVAHGDFQCNNAMSLAKLLKTCADYSGPSAPKAVAEQILARVPANPLIDSMTCAPNGFVNIKISSNTLVQSLAGVVQHGVRPPSLPSKKVLVDFSSPNIAKEMHVGHLRSTIIGDAVCKVLEFVGYDVMRVNHVGDWGTQFGMLITYLQDEFPDIITNPPNISDLTVIYKASKKRFDTEELFKERSRRNVVDLQAGGVASTAIWTLLCNISRAEFQHVYDALGVHLTEMGESFYNPFIPDTIKLIQEKGLVLDEEGMLLVKLPHFTIPLILRKSDGGYGYDSTDMAALKYRLDVLKRDWIIIITDAGQAPHFHMCYDTGRAMDWIAHQRLDHIGFGVVCGDDGKRFKTRSSETVRLIDLMNEAKDRMRASLQARAEEGKSPLTGDELESAAKIIGYGAIKYFDLKQHPSTNYIFSYDRMLDTKGDTAVYLLFAYARVTSILRKAHEEKGVDITALFASAASVITLEHPAERALAFELLQMQDVISSILVDLLPNKLCDYLKEVSVKFTDFVTKCHVLNSAEMQGRLLLCEATRRVMAQCFHLLGIETLERI